MASAVDVAARFVELSGARLSHLALQKLVYLAHMYHAGINNGAQLVSDADFQAWDLGPVSTTLYRKLRGFGSSPIPRVMLHEASPLSDAELASVQSVWDALKDASASRLVQVTHDPKGAWAHSYVAGVKGIPIPQREIMDEFARRSEH